MATAYFRCVFRLMHSIIKLINATFRKSLSLYTGFFKLNFVTYSCSVNCLLVRIRVSCTLYITHKITHNAYFHLLRNMDMVK